MNRIAFAGSALTGAIYSSMIPVVALVTMSPRVYGTFSVPYLIFALGISLQLSSITEAWARRRAIVGSTADWPDVWTALLTLSAIVAAAGGALAFALEPLRPTAALLAAAVLLALLRNGARFYAIAERRIRRTMLADASGILAFVLITVLGSRSMGPLTAFVVAWCAAGAVSLAWNGRDLFRIGRGPANWLRTNASYIRPLLADSLLLDGGSIGTPFLLAPFLGATRFGIYRGIANVALPVRLLLEPARPAFGRIARRRLVSPPTVVLVTLAASVLGGLCAFALLVAVPLVPTHLGTLDSLVPEAVPASVFVTLSFIGHFYYITARTGAAPRTLLLGRIVQTATAIGLPILGLALGELNGAIWGFVAATAASSITWLVLAVAGRGAGAIDTTSADISWTGVG